MMEEKLALAHILRKFDIVKENTVRDKYGNNRKSINFSKPTSFSKAVSR